MPKSELRKINLDIFFLIFKYFSEYVYGIPKLE